jgi:hypothetical protein
LTDLLDAAAAHESVRPSVFDLLHELRTMTSPEGVWLPSADGSGWSASSRPIACPPRLREGMETGDCPGGEQRSTQAGAELVGRAV